MRGYNCTMKQTEPLVGANDVDLAEPDTQRAPAELVAIAFANPADTVRQRTLTS